jgi:shikimate kinase
MMGSGKSVVGPLVADRLGCPFVDADAVVVERTNQPIATLWEHGGEASFREQESAAIAEIAAGPDAVVATGGGVVVDSVNLVAMGSVGSVVWLRAGVETLSKRLADDGGRPLLATTDRLETLQTILAARAEAYHAAADLVIDTDDVAVEEVADRIEAWWNES